jgi:N-acetyl-anhydromuramyl-L-alanine amidase AmpD
MEIKNQVKQLPWHPTRRWASRDISKINKIIIHQELGDSSIEAVNNYHINPNHISAKGCPHFCYHFGISKNGDIIQANELSSIVWQCKGQNSVGVGIMLVGNFKGPGHDLGADGPTKEQYESLEWLIKYLINSLKLSNTDVYGHYHFGKPACPGYGAQDWIESFRNQVFTEIEVKMTISEIQDRLNKLGYDAGPVDGVIGVKTLGAIRSFQEYNGLIIDGVVGPQTWKKLLSLSKK